MVSGLVCSMLEKPEREDIRISCTLVEEKPFGYVRGV